MMKRTVCDAIVFAAMIVTLVPSAACAWGIHSLITEAAVDLLPAWQRELIRPVERGLIDRYCIYPDDPRAPDAIPFLLKFPEERKVSHHIPGSLENHQMLFDGYLPRIVSLLRQQKLEEAMRFFGSLAHFLEDSSAPCHMRYGETKVPEDGPPLLQMDFFKRFHPLGERLDGEMLHKRIDNCPMSLGQLQAALAGHSPRLLGHSVEEITFNLLEEHLRANAAGSRQVLPMLQALTEANEEQFVACGVKAAAEGARLVADLLHSLLCVATVRLEGRPAAEVTLADRTPARGTPFSWSDRNHQGQLLRNASGAVYLNMSDPPDLGRHSLSLKMADGAVRRFDEGFGVGWQSEMTFLLSPGLFGRFTVYAGNDATLGGESINTFEILLDGQRAAGTGVLKGLDQPAPKLEVELGQSKTLTLRCQSRGKHSRTHGVWACPRLSR